MTKKLTTISGISLITWICVPVLVMILNALNTEVHITYNIWATVLYLNGGLGVTLGLIYLKEQLEKSKNTAKESISALAPIIAMLIFGLWATICSLAAKHPYVAFFGFTTMKDCMTTYFAYAGFIMSGLVLSQDKAKVKTVANIFIIISAILAIIALMNNDLTTKLTVNSYTNTFHYQSVFYNTNHYAYYLLLDIITSGFLFIFEENKTKKSAYIAALILFTTVLVFNKTMGPYLAVLLTLFFALIWSFINKDDRDEKINISLILAVFLITSFLVNLKTHTIGGNFSSMFSDAGALSTTIIDNLDPKDIEYIGSSRGKLWRLFWDVMIKYPILGVGPENVGSTAHNMFLQIGAFTGVVGLAIYLSIYVIGVIRLIRKRKEITHSQKACAFLVTGYLISGFFGVTMFYTAPYFYAILGICLSGALNNLTERGQTI